MEAEVQETVMDETERRRKSKQAIDHLVSTRTDMLSLLSQLASQQPLDDDDDSRELLLDFCEALIDYTATAHFQLYRFIDTKQERRKSVADLADRIYPQIMKSTQVILDFNDQYDAEKDEWDLENLPANLSKLGEALADRIELEDQLITVLKERR